MSGTSQLAKHKSKERNYIKNIEWYSLRSKINYRKRKINQYKKEIKKFQELEKAKEAKKK